MKTPKDIVTVTSSHVESSTSITVYASKVEAGFPTPAEDCAPWNVVYAMRAKALLTWVKLVRERVPYLKMKVKGDSSMVPAGQKWLKLFKLLSVWFCSIW